MGLAGAGMTGLAELLVRRGVRITGCDAAPSDDSVRDLTRIGIDVKVGHNPAHVAGARALVVTSAMPKDHPELEAARAARIPIVRRAEALGEATREGDV
ncbi:MAG TPA: Mur ligase domain-containing protein, partial [Gemmatimonadaceae bacterium]|nr:Mur ligase domain-containing protein [Gemmatimonadaceae bacterium]